MESTIREIKKQFFTFRNGLLADTLRQAGMPYAIIFGLQLPQLSQIAKSLPKSAELARLLWADRNVRESRLLAAWIFPADELNEEEAESMASDVLTREEADILAFRLMRNLPYAPQLARQLEANHLPLAAYAGQALRRNLQS